VKRGGTGTASTSNQIHQVAVLSSVTKNDKRTLPRFTELQLWPQYTQNYSAFLLPLVSDYDFKKQDELSDT